MMLGSHTIPSILRRKGREALELSSNPTLLTTAEYLTFYLCFFVVIRGIVGLYAKLELYVWQDR